MNEEKRLQACYEAVQDQIPFIPRVGLVLGSGWGGFVDSLAVEASIDYSAIPGFPVSTVQGHRGRFVFAHIQNVPAMIMQGRLHYYEGYSMYDVVLPIRLMGLCGIRELFLTNAAGGLNPSFQAGEFMLITDHIAAFIPSPLIGPNLHSLGPRFPDMQDIYPLSLRQMAQSAAKQQGIPLREGVYVQLTGPAYETPHEVALCRMAGGDAVGMSTACEAVAAHHMGIPVCGISLISNMGAGMGGHPLSHEEVAEAGARAAAQFSILLSETIGQLSR